MKIGNFYTSMSANKEVKGSSESDSKVDIKISRKPDYSEIKSTKQSTMEALEMKSIFRSIAKELVQELVEENNSVDAAEVESLKNEIKNGKVTSEFLAEKIIEDLKGGGGR